MLTAPRLAVGAVAAGTAIAFGIRTITWPSASSYDAWAYAAWGQAIARGEQLVYNLATTPKPLASLLGAIVSPLPPTRAMALVVALALGLLVASLVAAGYREAGALGAAIAALAFVLAARLDEVLWFSLIDAVTAALLALAVALSGRARIISLMLAGLLRPEAWPASALAGYVESAGSRVRKALIAVAAGVLPVVLWVLFDLVLAGDPLATREFNQGAGGELGERVRQSPIEALRLFWNALVDESATVFAIVGAVGLVVHGWRTRRNGGFPFPLAVAFVWATALLAETVYGFELNARYLLPLVAVLALGWGLGVGAVASLAWNRRPVLIWAAAAAAIAATAIATARMEFSTQAENWERFGLVVHRSLPTIEPVLECGRLGLVGGRYVGGTIAQLAASTRTSLTRFERVGSRPAERYAGILAVYRREPERLPPWPIREAPLGRLAVNPDCP